MTGKFARNVQIIVPLVVAMSGWGLPGTGLQSGFRAATVADGWSGRQSLTADEGRDENRIAGEMRRRSIPLRFPDDSGKASPLEMGGPLDGMDIETLLGANLHFLGKLPEWKGFCHTMAPRFLKKDCPWENKPSGAEESVSGGDKEEGAGMYREHYARTDFRPRRERSIPRQFAGLARDYERRKELLVLGEVVLYEIESSREFRRNNLTCAVALALGTAIEIERGQSLDETEALILQRSVHRLLTQRADFMMQSSENLTVIYDTCLLVSGLMAAFHGDACTRGRVELAAAARRLARSLLQIIGWPDGQPDGNGMVRGRRATLAAGKVPSMHIARYRLTKTTSGLPGSL